MRRVLAIVGVPALALVLAASAAGQRDEMPTRLWSEFPLAQPVERGSGSSVERSSVPSVERSSVPSVERSTTPGFGPLLPPTDSGTAPASDDAPPWAMWVLVAAAGMVALFVLTRLVRPAPAPRREREEPMQLRPQPHQLPRPVGSRRVLAQYAPSPSLVLADAPEEPWRSVIRRTGLLRSRYVVLEGQSAGEQEAVAASRSFWNVGGTELRERVAEDAWDDLMNDLRAAGWEPEPTRRSDHYVLLQPVEPEPEESSTIVPTLEAYGRAADSDGD